MPSLAGIVVRIPFARVTPDKPRERIARSTAPRDAPGIAVRRISAVIFLRPYKPSGVILRRVRPSGRGARVHAAARTASSTRASVMVRAAIRGFRQAR